MSLLDLSPGDELDGYRILGVLGQGGMGIVYEAEDIELNRTVALKLIDPKLARSEAFVRRFRAEARALARIQSPYIVLIHALRQATPHLFIVMEYVDGGTLKDRMQRGAVPWSEAAPIVEQMLRALEAAHSVHVVHRDIKPGNIMLSQAGTVKVTDFGLAKVHDPGADATMTQGVTGTLCYMSPEQAKGSPNLDHRSDLYSLGMTIYELLAGTLPFDRSIGEYAIMKTIVEKELLPLHKTNPRVSPALSEVVARALAKDPEARYATAREMLLAFQSVDAGTAAATTDTDATVVATPGSTEPSASPASSSRRLPWLAGGIGLVALLVAGWFYFGPDPKPDAGDGPAFLQISSYPDGATVWLSGRAVGTTPFRADTLRPGPTEIRLELAGYEPWEQPLTLSSGATASLDPTLTPLPTGLTIRSVPDRATVWIDGVERGQTPLTLEALPFGSSTIRLVKPDYKPWEEARTLEPGTRDTLVVTLAAADTRSDDPSPPDPQPARPASLTVGIQPTALTGAVRIEVDGTSAAAGTLALTPGDRHRIRCIHPTYGTAETSYAGAPGSSAARTCFFQGELVVTGEWADGSPMAPLNIEIRDADGQIVAQTNQLEYTFRTTLPAGSYRVRAHRDDMSIYRIQTAEQSLTIPATIGTEAPPLHRLVFKVEDAR